MGVWARWRAIPAQARALDAAEKASPISRSFFQLEKMLVPTLDELTLKRSRAGAAARRRSMDIPRAWG